MYHAKLMLIIISMHTNYKTLLALYDCRDKGMIQ